MLPTNTNLKIITYLTKTKNKKFSLLKIESKNKH